MATDITWASTPQGVQNLWTIPGGAVLPHTLVPRGEIIFSGSITIDLKIANDVLMWTCLLILPVNYCYRLVYAHHTMLGTSVTEVNRWEKVSYSVITEGAAGIADHDFDMSALRDDEPQANTHAILRFFNTGDDSALRAWLSYHPYPGQLPGHLINAGDGPAQVLTQLYQNSVSASTAYEARFRYRFLIYDIEQADYAPVHTPIQVISG